MPKKKRAPKYVPPFKKGLYCPRCRALATIVTPPVHVEEAIYKIRKVVLLPNKTGRYLVPTVVFDGYPRPVLEYTCVGQPVEIRSGNGSYTARIPPHKIRRMGKTLQSERDRVAIYNRNREREQARRDKWMTVNKGHIKVSANGYPMVKD